MTDYVLTVGAVKTRQEHMQLTDAVFIERERKPTCYYYSKRCSPRGQKYCKNVPANQKFKLAKLAEKDHFSCRTRSSDGNIAINTKNSSAFN